MIKRILVPLDISPYSHAATARACAISKENRAQVTGMTILDTPEISGTGLPFHTTLLKSLAEKAAERTEDAISRIKDGLQRFAETCEEQRVAHSEAEFQGVPSNRILQTADYYDLLIMGLRTFYHFETQDDAGNSLKEVLNHCHIPVLAVPKDEQVAFKNVLVAFDGSPSAVRALHGLVNTMAVQDYNVTLIMSDDDKSKAEFYLGQAAAFLRAHHVEELEEIATDELIDDVIDEEYIDDVDLVVLGVHTKRPIKDFFLGSLAERLIDYGHTAVLLGQ